MEFDTHSGGTAAPSRALHAQFCRNCHGFHTPAASLRLARRIKEHAEVRGITAGQFAVGWVLNNRLVTAAIAGPRTEEQWRDYLATLDYTFTAEDEALIDGLVAAGHPSTPGYNDPAYPLEGRRPWTAN